MAEFVSLEKEGKVAVITIAREKALNALNGQVLSEIGECVEAANADEDIFAVVITGKGKAFVAGADIAEMKDMNAGEAEKFSTFGQGVFQKIEDSKKPFIAAVHGFALGGGLELAMACDIRIASKETKIGQPEVTLGILPGFGGTQRLAKLAGEGVSKYLCMTGKLMEAEEAKACGIIDYITEQRSDVDEAIRLANDIAGKAPIAVTSIKKAINKVTSAGFDGYEKEAKLFGEAFSTKDQKEGMTAFLEKRKPEFKNE